ncbi:MAG: pyridoxal kinase [Legionellaceae bacterium]|nr:pyridoxal kinase [Legionellaceae bacterium]
MALILSIQSHVAYGYVGNRVATFALERLGHEVITINTVQFSNHTGYDDWQGDVFTAKHIAAIWNGIKQRVALKDIDALITGYLGDERLAFLVKDIATELQSANPNLLYCLDPVFGDVGRGLFVTSALAEYFRNNLAQQANLLTPNHFEFNYLTQQQNTSIEQIKKSAKPLFNNETKAILVTSYQGNEIKKNEIGMLLLTSTESWLLTTPKIRFTTPPNGSGDLVASFLLDKFLKKTITPHALAQIGQQIYDVFAKTKAMNRRELALIDSQDLFSQTGSTFEVVSV